MRRTADWRIDEVQPTPPIHFIANCCDISRSVLDFDLGGYAIAHTAHGAARCAAALDIERGWLDQYRPLFWQMDTSLSIKSWATAGSPGIPH